MALPAGTLITGVILAGGRGRRLGGLDKGLIEINGRTLIESICAALAPQVDELLINANRNLARYAQFGYPVHADVLPDFAGPLAGMLTGLERAQHATVVYVPCDTPALPAQLVARLRQAVTADDCLAAYAHDGLRAHPVYALLQRDCRADLRSYLDAGGRKVEDWLARVAARPVDFPELRHAIANINVPEDLTGL
jgi:molybdopterin-guanine dinucleotide biosynthesis protein A